MTINTKIAMKYKRFMVFTYDNYYPSGGLCDCCESFDKIEDAFELLNRNVYDHIEVFDRIEGVEVDITLYGLKY